MAQSTLTQIRLHEVLEYNPSSGYLVWKKPNSNRNKIGDIAGVVSSNGRRYIGVDGDKYLSHRLVWLYVKGVWPSENLTVENGNYDDTRIENLVERSVAKTAMMTKARAGNTSGHLGVSWNSKRGKWVAQITRNYKNFGLGEFDRVEDAIACRKEAELENQKLSKEESEFLSERAKINAHHRRVWKKLLKETGGNVGWASVQEFVSDIGPNTKRGTRLCPIDAESPIGPGNFIWMESLPKKKIKTSDYRVAKIDQYRDRALRRQYGESFGLREYQAKSLEQNGVCAICSCAETATRNGKVRYMVVDHNHVTEEIRGLLCSSCNVGIGYFKDDSVLVRKAADYIDKWNAPKEYPDPG